MSTTLTDPHHPTSRVAVGDHLLANAAALTAAKKKPVAASLAAFATQQKALQVAQTKVEKTEAAMHALEAKVGALSAAVDREIEAVASVLVTEGAKRTAPFAGLSKVTASALERSAHAEKAKGVGKLEEAVKARKSSSKALLAAAAKATKVATAMRAAETPLAASRKTRHAAIVARDAEGVPWAHAFDHLRHAAILAGDEGAVGLFDALFAPMPHVSHDKTPTPAPTPPATEPTPTK